jgi:hypothetical protein
MFNQVNNNKGITQVLVIFAMTALIGASALVIDAGSAMASRIQFSNAVDAAVLAGVMELPTDPDQAISVAGDYVVSNGFQLSDVIITVSPDHRSLTIVGQKNHDFFLAPVIGIASTNIGVRAKAMIGPAKSASGLRPFGIDNQDLIYGQQVVLKDGGGDGETGNFGGVAFANLFGASNFNYNILYGFDGEIEIGDIIDTEPGNMASSISVVNDVIDTDPYASFDNFEPDSPRVWVIPVLDDMSVDGRESVLVVGFAAFFIEEINNVAGQAEVTGRFIEFTTSGQIGENSPDIGVYAMKLVE